jgi:hypothetical protein
MRKTILAALALSLCIPAAFAITDAQRWAIALTEIMTRVNEDSHENLNFKEFTDYDTKSIQDMLVEDWGINNREELLATLDGMEKGGHTGALEKLKKIIGETQDYSLFNMLNAYNMDATDYNRFKFLLSNWAIYRNRSIAAWDYGRNISLCRWGFQCGYMTESEAWDKIMYYAKKIQPLYTSWKDYGADYYMGRIFWASGFGAEIQYLYKTANIYDELTANGGYWTTLDWNVDLDGVASEYLSPKNVDPAFKSQVYMSLSIEPHIVGARNSNYYTVSCQIKDGKDTNFSDTTITVDSVQIPYKYKKPYGYYFSKDLWKTYTAGQTITVRIESHLLQPETLTLKVPEPPRAFTISPDLPKKGVKNAQTDYVVSWDWVRTADCYRIGFISKVIDAPNTSQTSGMRFQVYGNSCKIEKKDLADGNGIPPEWLSLQLYTENRKPLIGYAGGSQVCIGSMEIVEQNNFPEEEPPTE